MKNTVLNQKQRDLVNEYYEFSKTVVASSFHFADGKEISTGYSLEDAYLEGAVALCTAALHFNADKGVSFKTYAAASCYPQSSEKGDVYKENCGISIGEH